MTTTPDVFFYEAFAEEEAELRHFMPNVRGAYAWQTIQESGHVDPPAPIISIRTQSTIPKSWAPKLKGILSRSTGYDHLERYVSSTGVPVACGYLPLYCARAVAEQALMMWLALLRKLNQQQRNFATFSRDGLSGGECLGRRLLVMGVGNIGYEVVKIGRGLGMEVSGVDLVHSYPDVRYSTIDEALPGADVVVCAMNLTTRNAGFFDRVTLSRAKRGVIFVNISRGELSPSADLLHLLETGVLGGVGLDVYDGEAELAVSLRSGTPSTDPRVGAALALAARENVILTPHNAFNSLEAVTRKSEHSAQQVAHMLRTGRWLWPMPTETAPTGAPHSAMTR